MATKVKNHRAHRWNLRVADRDDELVHAASDAAATSVSDFVRTAAVNEARRVLADRTRFPLDEEGWREFNALLDRPARVPEGLRRLFSRPSVFE